MARNVKTKKCYGCKEIFRVEELVDYASARAKITHPYCKKCLHEKQMRDKFSDMVCKIFGINSPGSRIWGDRKRIINTYGYTDDTIIDCLDYIYNVKKLKKLSESLYLVKPPMVDEMMQYKRKMAAKSMNLVRAVNTEMNEYVVPIKENNEQVKVNDDPDDWI